MRSNPDETPTRRAFPMNCSMALSTASGAGGTWHAA
jgi:hypothetical protein